MTQNEKNVNEYFNEFLKKSIPHLSTNDIPDRYFGDIKFDDDNCCYFDKNNKTRKFYAQLFRIEDLNHINGDDMDKITYTINNFIKININKISKAGFIYNECSAVHYTNGLFSIFCELI